MGYEGMSCIDPPTLSIYLSLSLGYELEGREAK